MPHPQPSEHHERLKALAGKWIGEETIHPLPFAPGGGKATSLMHARMDLDGFFLIADYVQERDGKVSFRGHGVYGYDPRQSKYTLHWFDVMGGDPGPPALGEWKGQTLTLLHQHAMGHSRYTYNITGRDAYTFKLEFSQDGQQWMPFLVGNYKRTV